MSPATEAGPTPLEDQLVESGLLKDQASGISHRHQGFISVWRINTPEHTSVVSVDLSPASPAPAPPLPLVDQPDASSFFTAAWDRSHKETWAGCMVSLTTLTRSPLKASRSVSSLSLAEKASRVFAASYLLR